MKKRLWPQRAGARALIEDLRALLLELQEENARLRVEAQRPTSPGRAAERISEVADALRFTDEGDEAWEALAEASVLRDALLNVCRELANCALQAERQLTTLLPPPELDRRVRDRRRSQPGRPHPNGSHGPGGRLGAELEEAS